MSQARVGTRWRQVRACRPASRREQRGGSFVMMKAEGTLDLKRGVRSLLKATSKRPTRRAPQRVDPQRVDPALISFARIGLLAYYR